MIGMGKKFTYH